MMPPPTQRRMITPAQLRAARALLDWTRENLAEQSGVAAVTAIGFEHGRTDPKISTLYKWRRALESAGVIFIDEDDSIGPGVRLRETSRKQETKKRR
jgi:transcriptional regulator with XRE-family HTH domain